MTSTTLKTMFACYAQRARFEEWHKDHLLGVKFVYACEFGVVWKFTPQEWWQLVASAVRNHGQHDLPQSNTLGRRPAHIIKGIDGKFSSTDIGIRCVNSGDWLLAAWEHELARK